MLARIKEQIENLPDISFVIYYQQFIMLVQDTNIDAEFKFLVKRNQLDVKGMQLLIQNTYEGVKSIHGYSYIITDYI